MSKLFEKKLFNKINSYIEPFFPDFLTGDFQRNHSTQHCLIKILEKWKHPLDNGYHIEVIFMDLSKAFDILNHPLLLPKLDKYGFSLKSTNFIQSWRNKKIKKVSVNNKFGAMENIYNGVSEGSLLGQLLFNIFINEIFILLNTCDMFSYVDDKTLYDNSR